MSYPGYIALSLIIIPTVLAFAALSGFARSGPDWALLTDPYLLGVLWFSLKQALLSALLSVLIALPVARALYYVPGLWGRRLFLGLCLLWLCHADVGADHWFGGVAGPHWLVNPSVGGRLESVWATWHFAGACVSQYAVCCARPVSTIAKYSGHQLASGSHS